uniref:Coenzyme Q-binding protein COQ10 START domain-containing protein n=1 Tax=Mycena chlorophos TaxID=658473 RepID=A0ABQ0LJD6_MYCCL|nr:predicted protein [Mycena chlorophos]
MPNGVPPLASSGVFCATDSIVIDAPRDKVWAALLDFGSYKHWNPFVRNQTIISHDGSPAPDQTPVEGKTILMSPVHLPPTMDQPVWGGVHSTKVRITTIDHENYRAAWITAGFPTWLLFCERWQMLTEVEGGKTRYESIEVFKGPLAYIVWLWQGTALAKAVTGMAEGLKKWVEQGSQPS